MIAALLKTEKEDYFQSRSSLQLQTNFQEITTNITVLFAIQPARMFWLSGMHLCLHVHLAAGI